MREQYNISLNIIQIFIKFKLKIKNGLFLFYKDKSYKMNLEHRILFKFVNIFCFISGCNKTAKYHTSSSAARILVYWIRIFTDTHCWNRSLTKEKSRYNIAKFGERVLCTRSRVIVPPVDLAENSLRYFSHRCELDLSE